MVAGQTKAQALRIGALAFFCGVPLLFVFAAIANLTEASQSKDLARRKTATTAAIVTQIEKHRARGVKPVDTSTLYLASATVSLARAEIQALATRLVDEAGGHVAEVQLVETPEQEADGTVAIQVALDIDNKGLRDLLYAIEAGLPLITVSDLTAQQGGTKAAEEGDDAPGGRLKVQMTLQGHWRKATG